MAEQKANWKAGLAFGKVAAMPSSDYKTKAGLVKERDLSKKKEPKQPERKPIERKKPLAKNGKKKTERLKAGGSEVKLFLEIWNERPHKCEQCGETIRDFQLWCFPHKLSKQLFPAHRLKKENIGFVCSIECHHKQDEKLNDWETRRILDEKLSKI